MVIGVLRIELVIPESSSLKDKRRTVRSLCDRVRSRFKVAASEVGAVQLRQKARIGVVCVSGSRVHAEQMIGNISSWFDTAAGGIISRCEWELIGDVWGDDE